jgi:hypothetical protein
LVCQTVYALLHRLQLCCQFCRNVRLNDSRCTSNGSSHRAPLLLSQCHLINQFVGIPGAYIYQITPSYCINGQFRGLLKSFIENLKYEPLFKSVVWVKAQQLLVSISCLAERFSSSLPEICNLSTKSRNFRWRKILRKKSIRHLIPCSYCTGI